MINYAWYTGYIDYINSFFHEFIQDAEPIMRYLSDSKSEWLPELPAERRVKEDV